MTIAERIASAETISARTSFRLLMIEETGSWLLPIA